MHQLKQNIMKLEIKTFAQRQKAQYIYETYFEPFSEHCIDFGLFDTLAFYGAITDVDADKHAKSKKSNEIERKRRKHKRHRRCIPTPPREVHSNVTAKGWQRCLTRML